MVHRRGIRFLALVGVSTALASACVGLDPEAIDPDDDRDRSAPEGSAADGSSFSDGAGGANDASFSDTVPSDGETPGDATSDALDAFAAPDADADAGVFDGGACATSTMFDPPVAVPGLNTLASERGFTLSDDGLVGVLARSSGSNYDLLSVSRPSVSDPFSVGGAVVTLTAQNEQEPSLSGDGRTLYYATSVGPVLEVFRATRPDTVSAFGAGVAVPGASGSDFSRMEPFLVRGGGALYVTLAPTAIGRSIHRVELPADGGSTSQSGLAIPPTYQSTHPVVSADEKTIFFADNGTGKDQVRMATRASRDAVWTNVQTLAPLASSGHVVPVHLSSDGCDLYMAVESPDGGAGNYDIMVAHRR